LRLAKLYQSSWNSSFFKSVAILVSGSALAKVAPLLASPVLTRLYTPADFGLVAVFIAVLSSLSPIICGKYEVAMVLPKSETEGKELLGISFGVATVISLTSLFVVVLFKENILTFLDASNLENWIYLLPLMLFLTGAMSAMIYYANRRTDYGRMAKGKMMNSFFITVTSIALGFLGAGFEGLLAGFFSGALCATTYLLFLYRSELTSDLLVWGKEKVALMKQYREFPIFNATTGLLDGVTLAMPVFFLTNYFSGAIVGYYALLLRVADTPLSFIASSVSEVNLKKTADLVNEQTDLRSHLLKLTLGLSAIVLFPAIILTIFSPTIFSYVFGEEWRESGVYLQILMPALAVRFVASTLATMISATHNNHFGAIWKVTAFLVTIIVYGIFAPQRDAILLFKAVVLMDIMLYLFYWSLIWKSAGNPRNPICRSPREIVQ